MPDSDVTQQEIDNWRETVRNAVPKPAILEVEADPESESYRSMLRDDFARIVFEEIVSGSISEVGFDPAAVAEHIWEIADAVMDARG